MNTEKDLQFYLDNTPLETVNKLSDVMEPENQKDNAPMIWELICQVWEIETGEKLSMDEMEDSTVDKIFGDFQTLVAIYVGCRRGHMNITEGRLILSDPNNAKFSLTPRGISYVENKIGKKK